MDNSVVIKGSKNGILVLLDENTDYEILKEKTAAKFRDSAKFLGDCKMAVAFDGKKLTGDQQLEMLRIINENSDLDVVCLLDNNPEHDRRFEKALSEKLMDLSSSTGQFYKGNLRSGQVLEMETSVIILGDVNPGASVVSKGNIVILGSLKGTAFAGASGNQNAFVLSLDMNPMQIRIADTIARSPDKPERDVVKEAKIAFLEDGNIYIEPLSKNVLNDIKLY